VLKKLAIVKGQGGYYAGKTGIIVAIRDEQIRDNERKYLYKLLIDGQITGWLAGEWLNVLEAANLGQDEAI
jgi:hypothetical protein